MPVPRRAVPHGGSTSRPLRAALPPAATTAAVPTVHPGRQEVLPAEQAIPMTLARAINIAKQSNYDRPLAYASDNYAHLLQRTLEAYDASQLSRSAWLASGTAEHQALAQTLAIKAALLNGLYMMRRCHKEWNIDPPVISLKTLENILPLFRHALGLCEKQPHGVHVSIKGLHPALVYLEKQVGLSLQSLETGHATGSQQALPASAAYHQAACRELGRIVQQLQAMPIHDPASRQTGHVEKQQVATTSSHPSQRSFKSVLIADPRAHPGRNTEGAGTAIGKSSAQRSIQTGSSRPAPRHDAAIPKVRREPRPITQGLETLHLEDRPAPGRKAKPHHPRAAESSAARPGRQPASKPALPETAKRGLLPTPAAAPAVAAERPVDPAAEAAARQRQEQLAELRTVLAPLRNEALRLHATAQASASAATPAGRPRAGHALEFTAWQSAAQAYDACAEALATHANEFSPIQREPTVRDLRCEFDAASRNALAGATQAAESALAVFLQAWDAALGQERVDGGACAELAALGRELQQQWLDAPLRPQMPVLGARMAVFDACEAISNVKAGSPATPGEAADLLCRATAEAQHACEGAKGALGTRLRSFRASCKTERDKLLSKVVRQEFEAANATHTKSSGSLRPLLVRSRAITTVCGVLLTGDPLPAAVRGGLALQTPLPPESAVFPKEDQDLIKAAHDHAATVRALREQAIKLPPDAPEQPALEQQAVLRVLRQSELTAESAAAAITSFHALHGALAHTPLDEQPSLVRSHVKAMKERTLGLNQALMAQETALEQISDARVRDLAVLSCALLYDDLRHVQTMQVSLNTLEKLLEVRVSANHFCRRMATGSREMPGPDVDGRMHRGITDWMIGSMKSIHEVLGDEQNQIKDAINGLRRRIDCDSVLIQGSYLLHAIAILAPTPDAMPLHQLDVVANLAQQSTKLSAALAQVTEDVEKLAASSTHKDEYQAQIDINKDVHQQLRAAQLQMLTTLRDLRATPPADSSSGSSSQAEVPAAQAQKAPQQGPPSRPSRRNKHR